MARWCKLFFAEERKYRIKLAVTGATQMQAQSKLKLLSAKYLHVLVHVHLFCDVSTEC